MSTHKHIDLICVVAIVLTLALTILFLNGQRLGIQPVNNDDADSRFTVNDRNGAWDASDATRIALSGDGGTVTGGGAYLYDGDVHIVNAGKYVLSGELLDGGVIIEAEQNDKIWLLLDGVTLRRSDSAAIRVEQAGKVFLTLAEGTENTVSSGAAYSQEAVEAGVDGAIYSRDDLTINGAGALTVTAEYQHAIVCNDDLVITGGTLDLTAAQDGLHANDSVRISDADITIHAGDDGVTVSNDDETAYFYMESGSLTIPACYEGIEAVDLTVAGGKIDITPTDDGLNANGQGQNAILRVTGGDLRVVNATGRDADGLDSNGSIEISGGNIFVSVNTASCALDCGTETGGTCTVSGGTVIAAGGGTMAEGFAEDSPQAFVMTSASGQDGAQITLTDSQGQVLISESIPCAFSNLVLTTPQLTLGDAVTLTVDDSASGGRVGDPIPLTVDNSSTTAAFGHMGGMRGMGGFGGMGGMGNGELGARPAFGQLPADGQTATGELPTDGQAADQSQLDGQTSGQAQPDGQAGNGGVGGQFPAGMTRPDRAQAGGQSQADGQTQTSGQAQPNTQGSNQPQLDDQTGQTQPEVQTLAFSDDQAQLDGQAPALPDNQSPALPDGQAPGQMPGQAPDGAGDDAFPGGQPPALPDGQTPNGGGDGQPPALPDGQVPGQMTDQASGQAQPDGQAPDGALPAEGQTQPNSQTTGQATDQTQPDSQSGQPSGQVQSDGQEANGGGDNQSSSGLTRPDRAQADGQTQADGQIGQTSGQTSGQARQFGAQGSGQTQSSGQIPAGGQVTGQTQDGQTSGQTTGQAQADGQTPDQGASQAQPSADGQTPADGAAGTWVHPEGGMFGDRGGGRFGGQFAQDGQAAAQAADSGFQIDAVTAALVAASALVLLVGLLIAFKFKR